MTVQFLKNPHHLHWGFDAVWLGEDEWGDWVSVPAGSRRWKGSVEMGPAPEPAVFCAPRDRWWHLHYNGSHAHRYTHFVDIVTPPVWVSSSRYEMIDLDLDVAVRVGGEIEVQDEDEFEDHQVIYSYTPDMIEAALRTTDEVVEALRGGAEPFHSVAEAWLARAVLAHPAG